MVAEKRRCIEPDHPQLSIKRQCELIGLPRPGYYRDTGGGEETAQNLVLMQLIDGVGPNQPSEESRRSFQPGTTPTPT